MFYFLFMLDIFCLQHLIACKTAHEQDRIHTNELCLQCMWVSLSPLIIGVSQCINLFFLLVMFIVSFPSFGSILMILLGTNRNIFQLFCCDLIQINDTELSWSGSNKTVHIQERNRKKETHQIRSRNTTIFPTSQTPKTSSAFLITHC